MVAAAIGAAASIAGSAIASSGAKKAASTQAASADAATQVQREALQFQRETFDKNFAFNREIYDTSRADLAPYRQAGVAALDVLVDMFIPGGQAGVDASERERLQGLLDSTSRTITQSDSSTVTEAPDHSARIKALQKQIGALEGLAGEYDQQVGGFVQSQQANQQIQQLREEMNMLTRLEAGGTLTDADRQFAAAYGIDLGGSREVARDIQVDNPEYAQIQGQIDALGPAPEPGAETQAPDYSAFYKSPGYEFRLDEGVGALDKSAAARGKLRSGGYGRELTRYGQGVASGEFNNYANRLASIAGLGQTSAAGSGALGAQAAGTASSLGNAAAATGGQISANIGNALQSAGGARASGYVGSSNAINQGIGNALFSLQDYSGGTTTPQRTGVGFSDDYGGF